MANQRTNLNQMVSPIPKIQIIPPTPDIGPSGEESATETVNTAIVWQPDSDGFKDPESQICEEVPAEKPTQVVMEVDGQVPVRLSEREVNENEEDIFRNLGVETCLERCMRVLGAFNESKYMLILQFLLLAIPISAGFMGAKYLDKCPLSSETPVFLFMMGIAGTIVIICRILLISQKILLPTHREWEVLRVVVIVGNLAIIVCLATEMFSFFRTVPSFEIGSAHYCHEIFYKYTYWANWTCLIVITFLLLLQLPNCSVVALQNDEML